MSNLRNRSDRIGLGDAIIMGLSSSGPSQTLAVSLAALVAVSGYSGVVPLLICFVPMIGIAIAYQRLNRWDQSSGATYTWVARVFNPYLGFLSGWMILLYYTLGTTTLTIPAGVDFQFRSQPAEALAAVAITMRPWPGDGEAEFVDGRWQPTVPL